MGSSVHNNSLIVDFIFKLQKLELFDVVTDSRHHSSKYQTSINSERLDVASFLRVEHGDSEINGCRPDKEDDVVVFKLSGQKGQEALDSRQSYGVLSKQSYSSLEILSITDNTGLSVSVEKSTQTLVVPAVSEDVQRDSAFALVVWLLHIFLLEEMSHIVLSDPKDVLVGQLGLLGMLIELWSDYI